MKKLELPILKQEWHEILRLMDKKALKLSDEEVQKEESARDSEMMRRARTPNF
jgi:hypothetical protein